MNPAKRQFLFAKVLDESRERLKQQSYLGNCFWLVQSSGQLRSADCADLQTAYFFSLSSQSRQKATVGLKLCLYDFGSKITVGSKNSNIIWLLKDGRKNRKNMQILSKSAFKKVFHFSETVLNSCWTEPVKEALWGGIKIRSVDYRDHSTFLWYSQQAD